MNSPSPQPKFPTLGLGMIVISILLLLTPASPKVNRVLQFMGPAFTLLGGVLLTAHGFYLRNKWKRKNDGSN